MSRFSELEGKLSHEKGVSDPAALAASIGRKKYGKKKYQDMAAKGRKKALSDEVFVIPDVQLWQMTKNRQASPELIKGAWAAVHTTSAQNILNNFTDLAEYRIAYFANKNNIPLDGLSKEVFEKAVPVLDPGFESEKSGHFIFDENSLLRYVTE